MIMLSTPGVTVGRLGVLDICLIIGMVILVIVGFTLFRINYRSQMRVSQYMDTESDVFNETGLAIYLKRKRKKITSPALVAVQLVNLKTLHHDTSDKKKLMIEISNVMLKGLRPIETLARVEFDKFVIVYSKRTKEEIVSICHKLEETLQTYQFDEYGEYKFILEFGIYENPFLKDPHECIHRTAATAKYSVVSDGNIHYYCEEVEKALARLQRINDLKEVALQNKQFVPYVQPLVDFKTGKVIGGEVLVRWVDAEMKPIYFPDEFIPQFEESGFMKKVDFQMLESACSLAQSLAIRGHNDIIISVNFSKVDFEIPNLAQEVVSVVSKYQIKPSNIQIEVTENAVMSNPLMISNRILELRQFGFLVAMDDFGKEYSSLGSLSTNPFDEIKLDMVFFRDRLKTEKNRTIVHNMINMLTKLKYKIVCEGVEDEATLDVLATMNRNIIVQGYCFSRPIPAPQFESFAETQFTFNYATPAVEDGDLLSVDQETGKTVAASQPADPAMAAMQAQVAAMQAQFEKMMGDQKKQAEEKELEQLKQQMAALQAEPEDELTKLRRQVEELKKKKAEEAEAEKLRQELAALNAEPAKPSKEENTFKELLGESDEEEEDMSSEDIARAQAEADSSLDLDVESLSDEESVETEDDGEQPSMTREEVESLIKNYHQQYQDDWVNQAKQQDNFAELFAAAAYYQNMNNDKKTLIDKIKKATPQQKQIFNIIKNELMQYEGVTSKLSASRDTFYMGRKIIAKMSMTSKKVRIFLAADPNAYPQYPNKNVGDKKAHASTPYYTLLESKLSVKRIKTVIADMMKDLEANVRPNYKPIDYATKYKFYKSDQK